MAVRTRRNANHVLATGNTQLRNVSVISLTRVV
jgi:hypothetical protein